jgi:uncharacterized protein (DUF4213/DUF364 family)
LDTSWEIYDRLIDEIAPGATAASCLVSTWTVVESDGMGMAMTYRGGVHDESPLSSLSGRPLRELAGYVKSWDLRQASLGMAAINAFHNAPERVQKWLARPLQDLRSPSAFISTLDEIAGKKVAVIGHFPGLEAARKCCDLIILERNPQDGDLPDFAAEYVLPQQDYVFITGTAITNKTLPRLLALSSGATVALVGPSVPLVPWWFEYGIDMLAGTVVMDRPSVWRCCLEGAHKGVFDAGAWMVDIRRHDLRRGTQES